MNISRATAIAACYVALKHLFPDVPANAGVLDAVDFVIPDRLVISAERPRPVGGYTETILRMIDVIFSAAAQADPTRAMAQAYGTINALSIAGPSQRRGRAKGQRWVMFSFFGGGHGGHSDGDGLCARQCADLDRDHSAARDPRSRVPGALHRMVAASPTRAATASYRGGLGAVYEIELLEKDAEVVRLRRARHARRPRASRAAARARSTCSATRTTAHGTCRRWSSKMRGIRLARGERVRLETPGGGGWGAPSERDDAASASATRPWAM